MDAWDCASHGRLLRSAGVSNIRVIEADAQQALPILLGPASVREVWTFFPDPWRKAGSMTNAALSPFRLRSWSLTFWRTVVCGAWRRDWENYAEQMLEVMTGSPDFQIADDEGVPHLFPTV